MTIYTNAIHETVLQLECHLWEEFIHIYNNPINQEQKIRGGGKRTQSCLRTNPQSLQLLFYVHLYSFAYTALDFILLLRYINWIALFYQITYTTNSKVTVRTIYHYFNYPLTKKCQIHQAFTVRKWEIHHSLIFIH